MKGSSGCRVPLDPAVGVAHAVGAACRSGPGVAPGCADSTGVAGGVIAGFGPDGAVAARFATGDGAARGAGVPSLTSGGANCDGGEEQGEGIGEYMGSIGGKGELP